MPGLGETRPRGSLPVARVLPGKESPAEGAPDEDADPVVLGKGLELVLEAASHEAVVHLRGDELLQAQALLHVDGGGALPGKIIAEPDMADLALADQVIQRPQGLLQGRAGIPAVHLVQVDVVGLQPLEARLDPPHDVHPGGAAPVEVLAHRHADLGGQDDLLPHAFQRVAQQGLALPARIDVRRVDEIDSPVEGQAHHLRGGLLVQAAETIPAELHRPESHLAHDQTCPSQCPVSHSTPPAANVAGDGGGSQSARGQPWRALTSRAPPGPPRRYGVTVIVPVMPWIVHV